MADIVPIRRALLSVSDKTGLIELARPSPTVASISWPAAGRGRPSSAPGSRPTEVAEYTGQPEILGGRVKTLHPSDLRRDSSPAETCPKTWPRSRPRGSSRSTSWS